MFYMFYQFTGIATRNTLLTALVMTHHSFTVPPLPLFVPALRLSRDIALFEKSQNVSRMLQKSRNQRDGFT